MIRYTCPACQRIFSVPDGSAGQTGNCPGCGQRLRIPGGRTTLAAPYREGQRTTLAEQGRICSLPNRPQEEALSATTECCPKCGGTDFHVRDALGDNAPVSFIAGLLLFPLFALLALASRESWLVCSSCGKRLRKLAEGPL